MSNARLTILQARAVKDKLVSDAQFRTLAALGMYADEDGWCWPSLKTLGNDLGKSKQAVGRDTIALRKLGYLEVKPQFKDDGSRRSSLYRLRFDLPPLPPRQPDVDTPTTPQVDTPSTSEVDVNVPVNDPSKQELFEAANKTVTTYLQMAQAPGMKKMIRIDSILSYIGGSLHINTETKRWKEFAQFADERQQLHGESIGVFIIWLTGQKNFDIQYWPPSKMREMWPQAFVHKTDEERPEYKAIHDEPVTRVPRPAGMARPNIPSLRGS